MWLAVSAALLLYMARNHRILSLSAAHTMMNRSSRSNTTCDARHFGPLRDHLHFPSPGEIQAHRGHTQPTYHWGSTGTIVGIKCRLVEVRLCKQSTQRFYYTVSPKTARLCTQCS